MTSSSMRRAMTWGTVAAAVASALLVAGSEAGWSDRVDVDGRGKGGLVSSKPGALGGSGTAAGRSDPSRRDLQQH